jgi:hypothetical protein
MAWVLDPVDTDAAGLDLKPLVVGRKVPNGLNFAASLGLTPGEGAAPVTLEKRIVVAGERCRG